MLLSEVIWCFLVIGEIYVFLIRENGSYVLGCDSRDWYW